MTTCGYFWLIVVIVLAVIGVTVSAVRAEKGGKPKENGLYPKGSNPRRSAPRNDGAVAPAEPGAIAYRRGGARYVTCRASTRLDDGYIVSLGGRSGADLARMTIYAKKELAAVLAEQALAAGGIEFSQVGGELRAVMRTVTGKEDTDYHSQCEHWPRNDGEKVLP